jgi:hypothetical protein
MVGYTITSIIGAVMILAIGRWASSSRDRFLARKFPSAFVVSASPSSELRKILPQAREKGIWSAAPDRFPSNFTLLANSEGLSLWQSVTAPFLSIPWSDVRSITAGEVIGGRNFTYAGMVASIAPEHKKFDLPLFFMGGGIFKLGPLGQTASKVAIAHIQLIHDRSARSIDE